MRAYHSDQIHSLVVERYARKSHAVHVIAALKVKYLHKDNTLNRKDEQVASPI
jgi:cytochrome b561